MSDAPLADCSIALDQIRLPGIPSSSPWKGHEPPLQFCQCSHVHPCTKTRKGSTELKHQQGHPTVTAQRPRHGHRGGSPYLTVASNRDTWVSSWLHISSYYVTISYHTDESDDIIICESYSVNFSHTLSILGIAKCQTGQTVCFGSPERSKAGRRPPNRSMQKILTLSYLSWLICDSQSSSIAIPNAKYTEWAIPETSHAALCS